ncbi:MAG TPA: DEAD/DEAH box helicase [Anaerolineales bacterium]|nr:DEAD/DEAH box helicase [Anaerolineales bacterium]
MSFESFNLDARIQASIQRIGYHTPTPIQQKAIPIVLDGEDLIATAQTGTGKTAAFALPILQKLLFGKRNAARALIIAPTRELAEQILQNIRALTPGTRLRTASIYGGVGSAMQLRALKDGTEILVACPGRLLDHIRQGNADLSQIEILVLDEADHMLDMGFFPSIREILRHIPQERQTLMFSATFPAEIEKLAKDSMSEPQRIAIGLSRPTETVQHALYPVANHLKTPLLSRILKEINSESVLVFTRTKHRAQKVTHQLEREGYNVTTLHSNRSQVQRQTAINGFREGKYQVMVATDIAARGIDVQSVSHVINYDMPDTSDAYTHRIGRTGRAQRSGDAFTFVTNEDNVQIRTLEKVMGETLQRKFLADFDYHAPAPARHRGGEQLPEEIRPIHKPMVVKRAAPAPKLEKPTPAEKPARQERDVPSGEHSAPAGKPGKARKGDKASKAVQPTPKDKANKGGAKGASPKPSKGGKAVGTPQSTPKGKATPAAKVPAVTETPSSGNASQKPSATPPSKPFQNPKRGKSKPKSPSGKPKSDTPALPKPDNASPFGKSRPRRHEPVRQSSLLKPAETGFKRGSREDE